MLQPNGGKKNNFFGNKKFEKRNVDRTMNTLSLLKALVTQWVVKSTLRKHYQLIVIIISGLFSSPLFFSFSLSLSIQHLWTLGSGNGLLLSWAMLCLVECIEFRKKLGFNSNWMRWMCTIFIHKILFRLCVHKHKDAWT